jgi:hypothetical protein
MVAASAVALAVLHILRVRSREVRVITTMFWGHALEHSRARTLFERFRHPWTYALLLLTAALLSLALSRPERTTESADRAWEVIVVDGGASMSASLGRDDRSRFDAARDAVLEEAGRLASDDRLAIIVADPWPRMVHAFDTPRPLIGKGMLTRKAATASAATDASLRLARSLLDGRPNGRILLITDRAPDADTAAGVAVKRVDQPASNAAILSAMFEPDAANPLRGRLSVRVGYWGETQANVVLSIRRAGGAPLFNQQVAILPGAAHDFVLADQPADGDTLVADLPTADAIDSDNRMTLSLPLRTPIRIAVDAQAPATLRLALQSNPAVRLVSFNDERDICVNVGTPGGGARRPAVLVAADGEPVAAGQTAQFVGSLAADAESGTCGAGRALGPIARDAAPLIAAGDATLAAISTLPATQKLFLSPALFADDATIQRRAGFAVVIVRAVCKLAGWQEDPITLTVERSVRDPLWVRATGGTDGPWMAPGERVASDLSSPPPTAAAADASPTRRSLPALFEWLLLAAAACFMLDAALHTRGRIP